MTGKTSYANSILTYKFVDTAATDDDGDSDVSDSSDQNLLVSQAYSCSHRCCCHLVVVKGMFTEDHNFSTIQGLSPALSSGSLNKMPMFVHLFS